MTSIDLQRTELYLSEIYSRAIKELELHDLVFESNYFNEENYLRLVNFIEQLKSIQITTKLSKLYDLLIEGRELIYEMKAGAISFSELDMKEFVDYYLELDPDYIESINIELLKQPFDLETKAYKKYLKLKKEELFIELINAIYTEQPYSWKSITNVVESTYNSYMAEFKKFDVAWLECEISNKENYLPQIEGLFTKNQTSWDHVSSSEHPIDIVIKLKVDNIPDLIAIKSETIKTQNEIMLLSQLLSSLKSPLPDQDFIKKYLPYYGEGTERLLRGILSNNKELISKIINK